VSASRGRQPARQPRDQPPAQASYAPVLAGLVACAKCAALLVDADAPKAAHARFHEGLRQLWNGRG
jgi:hypothetical protein